MFKFAAIHQPGQFIVAGLVGQLCRQFPRLGDIAACAPVAQKLSPGIEQRSAADGMHGLAAAQIREFDFKLHNGLMGVKYRNKVIAIRADH